MLKNNNIPSVVRYLLRDEAISGKLILIATAIALLLANTILRGPYEEFWQIPLSIGLGDWLLTMDLRHWVNEGLMTLFFLVVGLEIKREIVEGELKKFQTAVLPIAAAIGGMVIPALLYMVINAGSEAGFRGWAIPMATDIAFAIGLLALLGRRIPFTLRLFLLSLAIVDDIVAIIVIALFYGNGFNFLMLGMVVVLSALIIILQKGNKLSMPIFILLGIGLWLAMNASGVHASIAGALLGMLAPIYAMSNSVRKPLAERLERYTIPVSTLVVIPLFAFANTGVQLSVGGFTGTTATIAWGIIAGLVLGKVLGIVGASWLVVKLGIGKLPDNVHWSQMVGVGMLAGIGFTVSIFVTELAFAGNEELLSGAKLSIFAASAVSGAVGLAVLRFLPRKRKAANA